MDRRQFELNQYRARSCSRRPLTVAERPVPVSVSLAQCTLYRGAKPTASARQVSDEGSQLCARGRPRRRTATHPPPRPPGVGRVRTHGRKLREMQAYRHVRSEVEQLRPQAARRTCIESPPLRRGSESPGHRVRSLVCPVVRLKGTPGGVGRGVSSMESGSHGE